MEAQPLGAPSGGTGASKAAPQGGPVPSAAPQPLPATALHMPVLGALPVGSVPMPAAPQGIPFAQMYPNPFFAYGALNPVMASAYSAAMAALGGARQGQADPLAFMQQIAVHPPIAGVPGFAREGAPEGFQAQFPSLQEVGSLAFPCIHPSATPQAHPEPATHAPQPVVPAAAPASAPQPAADAPAEALARAPEPTAQPEARPADAAAAPAAEAREVAGARGEGRPRRNGRQFNIQIHINLSVLFKVFLGGMLLYWHMGMSAARLALLLGVLVVFWALNKVIAVVVKKMLGHRRARGRQDGAGDAEGDADPPPRPPGMLWEAVSCVVCFVTSLLPGFDRNHFQARAPRPRAAPAANRPHAD
ncbi:unnamed protein product [Pedinophyceae sp. YPF-701]|nr:unnamed protein product [Pedinophyceae sp. YPF-701]